jgi:phosphoribosyl 1,2-cyclic phosphodiesterase
MAGESLDMGDIVVHTVPTPHDGVDGVAFVVEVDGKRLGVLADLGHVFDGLGEIISSLDGVFIESNYDPQMLRDGPYPWSLQQRISGPRGHISNGEAGKLLASSAGAKLQWAVLSHLSAENNQPDLAGKTVRSIVGPALPVHVASRYEASGLFEL